MTDSAPVVPGFRLQRDPLTDEWIATSRSGFVLRGWSQEELEAAWWALWQQILVNFRAALVEVYPGERSLQTPAPVRAGSPEARPDEGGGMRPGKGPRR